MDPIIICKLFDYMLLENIDPFQETYFYTSNSVRNNCLRRFRYLKPN